MTILTHHVSRDHVLRFTLIVLLVVISIGAPAVSAQGSITIDDRGTTIEFPQRLTFEARVESSAEIKSIVLEYGVDKLTCGTVTAKAFPDFKPGKSANVTWTWEMLKSGSQPPGAQIWYRWRATDASGNESVTDQRQIAWLNPQQNWNSMSQGLLTLHWYEGSRSFAEDLLTSAVDSLKQLEQTTGVAPESPIDMYIYANTGDMREAVLYEPGWTGGLAYPDYDILIIGIGPDQVDWGKRTQAHELTHVLVGHLTFSCLGSVPTWLNEGIAVYGKGAPDRDAIAELNRATADDRLMSVRALSGGFSEDPQKADLSYSQSYSLVNFLVTTYGRDKLIKLFGDLRDSLPIEAALKDSYGFGLDGLESQWRASIGAKPRQAEGAAPTPTPIPTPIPTYRPISSAPVAPVSQATRAPSPTLTIAPTPAPAETAIPAAPAGASPSTPLIATAAVLLVAGIAVIFIAVQRRKIS